MIKLPSSFCVFSDNLYWKETLIVTSLVVCFVSSFFGTAGLLSQYHAASGIASFAPGMQGSWALFVIDFMSALVFLALLYVKCRPKREVRETGTPQERGLTDFQTSLPVTFPSKETVIDIPDDQVTDHAPSTPNGAFDSVPLEPNNGTPLKVIEVESSTLQIPPQHQISSPTMEIFPSDAKPSEILELRLDEMEEGKRAASECSQTMPYQSLSSRKKYSIKILGSKKVVYKILTAHGWLQFNKKGSSHTDSIKFHVSIARKDMEQAFYVLLPLLADKHNLGCFKILPNENLTKRGNLHGKEFVLYAQPDGREDRLEFWSEGILKEVVEALTKAQVCPGEPSLGDIPVRGGNGYIYTRSPLNVFQNYVPAELLQNLGFSRDEAARLSPSPWLDLIIEGEEETEKETQIEKEVHSLLVSAVNVEQERTNKIYCAMLDDLKKKWRDPYEDLCLYLLIEGIKKPFDDKPRCQLANYLFEWHEDGEDYPKPIKINFTLLDPYLAKAAYLSAALYTLLGKSHDQIGKIFPALYYYCLVPLAKKEINTTTLNTLPLSEEEEKEFIKQIALCTLRTRSNLPEPFLVNEEELDILIDCLKI
jgi:hypothetical protein